MASLQLWGSEWDYLTPRTYEAVFVKSRWSDPWTYIPYLRCDDADETAWPSIAPATLHYDYGWIWRHDQSGPALWNPVTIVGCYVQVVAYTPWGAWVPFIGFVESERRQVVNTADYAQGHQVLQCYDFGALLDRLYVINAMTDNGIIERELVFNGHDRGLGRQITGNRSAVVDVESNVYYFSTDGYTWTYLDIAEYLVQYYANVMTGTLQFVIRGATDALDCIEDEYRHGETVFESLNALINRKRGLGACLIVPLTDGAPVIIYVYSLLDQSIETTEVYLPANPDRGVLDVRGVRDASIEPREEFANAFNRIAVLGGWLHVCCSFSEVEGSLEAGWTPEQEADYNDADDVTRGSEALRAVYQKFVVPSDWDWYANAIDPAERYNANPLVLYDCTLDLGQQGVTWPWKKSFERQIPLLEAGGAGQEADYRPLCAFVYPEMEKVWQMVNRVKGAGGQPGTVQPCDGELGFWIETIANHIAAWEDFSITAISDVQPAYDWRKTIITAMVQTDQRLHCVIETGLYVGETDRVKPIVIADAEAWLIIPGTKLDLPTEGTDLVTQDEYELVRDDSARVRSVAALAQIWFSRVRIPCAVKWSGRITPICPVSVFIDGIAAAEWIPSGTVVTRRHWNFTEQTTSLQTQYDELDWSAASKGKRK